MSIQPIGPGTYPAPPPNSVGPRIAAYAHAAGFSGNDLITAVAIAKAESGWSNTAKGGPNSDGTYDWGLWQINDVHKPSDSVKHDPAANARAAYAIYSKAGNKFTPWATFNSGKYKQFLSESKDAVKQLQSNGPDWERNLIKNSVGAPENKDTNVLSNLNPINNVVSSVGSFVGKLANNFLGFGVGLVLLVLGIVILLRRPIASVAKEAAKATPAGRAVSVGAAVAPKPAPKAVKAPLSVEERAARSLDYSEARKRLAAARAAKAREGVPTFAERFRAQQAERRAALGVDVNYGYPKG